MRNGGKILITQMRNAIDPKYFEEQLHATTLLPIGDIATILSNLFTNYRPVTQTHLEQERVTIVAMDYQMSEPIETIYKAITDYGRMCTSAKVPSTELHLIGVGLFIFNKSNLMTKFVTKWEKKTWHSKLWKPSRYTSVQPITTSVVKQVVTHLETFCWMF